MDMTWGKDKFWHLMAFFGATVGMGLLLHEGAGLSIEHTIFLLIILGLGAGLGKEVLDKKRTGFDMEDMKYNILAMTFGFMVIALIQSARRKEDLTWFAGAVTCFTIGMIIVAILGGGMPW
jgi:hypothetical protein